MQANPLAAGDLAAFVAAMEAGTINGAADALDLTQSAVTKRVQSLERRLGSELLTRGRLGVRPTADGRALYPEAKQALAALADAERAVTDRQQDADKYLSLAASHTVGEFLLPGWLAAFRHQGSTARPQVDVVNSPGVLEAVREGEAEVGFVEGLDPLDDLDSLVVYRDEIVVVVASGHPWTRRRTLQAADLAKERYVTREEGSGTRTVAAAALRAAHVEVVPALEMSSTESVKRALAAGGFSLLSLLAVQAEQRAGTLHVVNVPDLGLQRELHAIRLRRGRSRRAAASLWQWMTDQLRAA